MTDSETTDKHARREEIVDAENKLNEVEAIDLRRRMHVVSAVIRLSPRLFARVDELRKSVKGRRDSDSPHWWFWGALVFGALLHYFLTDNQWVWSFGMTIMVAAGVMYATYHYDTHKAEVLLRKGQKEEWNMLFEWVANGGHEDRFWTLRKIMEKNDYDIMDSEEYNDWWYEQKADQIANIKGRNYI